MPPLHCTKMAEILNLAAERIVSKRRRRWPQKRSGMLVKNEAESPRSKLYFAASGDLSEMCSAASSVLAGMKVFS